MANTVSFEDFKKLDLRVGTIVEAEKIEGADKLLKLSVDIGPSTGAQDKRETRTLVAGIAQTHEPASLAGRQVVVVANLEPRVLKGVESQGMLLAAAKGETTPVLLVPEKEVPAGTKIR